MASVSSAPWLQTLLRLAAPAFTGFYINATVEKWKNWRMYDYITKVCAA